jgi:dGTPase
VPRETRAEIAVLKGIVAANVMSTNARKPIYARQRDTITELAEALLDRGPEALDAGFAADWREATTDAGRKRAVVDQVASLTDQSANAWHKRLVAGARP